jgi:hypothetical protein
MTRVDINDNNQSSNRLSECATRCTQWLHQYLRVEINLQYHSPMVDINENQLCKPIFHQSKPTTQHQEQIYRPNKCLMEFLWS